MRIHALALLALTVFLQPAIAADSEEVTVPAAIPNDSKDMTKSQTVAADSKKATKPKKSKFSVFGAAVYGPRTIGGTIFVDRGKPATSTATAEQLGLGTEESMQFLLGVRYDRWRVSFGYLPTNFTGNGKAEVTLDVAQLPPITVGMPVSTNIDVNLLLAHVSYDVYQGEKWVWALGAGLGRTEVDVALTPKFGAPLAFDGNEPFGYIGGDVAWRFAPRWNLTGTIQWISGDFAGSEIDYGNYNLALGYLLTEKHVRTEIVGGYRYVSFDYDYTVGSSKINTDISLKGPYIGLGFSW